MIRFKSKIYGPPGGRYFFEIPELKRRIEAKTTLGGFIYILKGVYNKYKIEPPPNLEELVQDYMCRYINPKFCEGDDLNKNSNLAWKDNYWYTIRKTRELAGIYGKEQVGVLIAEDRANVCLTCPMNSRSLCYGCLKLFQTLKSYIQGDRRVKSTSFLGVCLLTGGYIPVIVFFKHVDIDKDVKQTDIPEKCWLGSNKND